MVSDFTFQLTFKKLPLIKFWYNIKREYPQLSEKATKIIFFPTTYPFKAGFSSYSSAKVTF